MKTYILLLALFLFSCKSESDNQSPANFTKELMSLSTQNFDLFNRTRSGTTTLNMDAFNQMIGCTTNLSETYDLSAIVRASGYYSNTDQSLVDMDLYETLKYFRTNSTPEFYDLISSMVIDEKGINNEDIISNDNLLPNEQIALILVNGMIKSNIVDLQTKGTSADCRPSYNKSMKSCNTILYLSSALSITLGIASCGILAGACGVATGVDYARCSSVANDTYMGCIEQYL